MRTFFKLLLQLVATLLSWKLVTHGLALANEPYDVAVLGGAVLVLVSVAFLFFVTKYIWRKHVTNKKED